MSFRSIGKGIPTVIFLVRNFTYLLLLVWASLPRQAMPACTHLPRQLSFAAAAVKLGKCLSITGQNISRSKGWYWSQMHVSECNSAIEKKSCCTAKSQAWQAQRRLRSFPYCMKPHQKEEDAPKTETQRLSGSPSVSWKLLVWIPFTKRTQKWNSNFLEKPMGQLEMARQSSFILHFGKRNTTPKLNATKKK